MASGRVLSIEINQIVTKICEVEARSRNPKVCRSFIINTPAGVIKDGLLQPNEAYAKILQDTFLEQKIKAKKVIFSISSTKIASREVTIPYVKENKVGEVIQAKAEEFFPVDLSDYKVSYTLLGEVDDEKGQKKRKALVLAAPINLLKGYYELAGMCGLEVDALDYVGNSLLQAVRENCDEGVQAVAKIDENSTLMVILKNGDVASIRNIPYGVSDAINIMASKGRHSDSDAEGDIYRSAVAELREHTYIKESDQESGREVGAIVSEITSSLDYLINGIARVLDFYNSRSGGELIEKLHLTGVGASFKGMSGQLQKHLELPVASIKSIEGLTVPRDFDARGLGDYIANIGAVIHPLDLLLAEKKEKRTGKEGEGTDGGKDHMTLSLLICGGCVIIAIALAMASMIPYKMAELEKARLLKRIEELKPVEELHNTYVAATGLWTDAENMKNLTKNHNDELVAFIQELEQKMPSDIVVLSMVAAADNVTMNIDVSSKESAAKVLQELDDFESIEITQTAGLTDLREDGGVHVVSFSVNCIYAEPEGNARTAQTGTEAAGASAESTSADTSQESTQTADASGANTEAQSAE